MRLPITVAQAAHALDHFDTRHELSLALLDASESLGRFMDRHPDLRLPETLETLGAGLRENADLAERAAHLIDLVSPIPSPLTLALEQALDVASDAMRVLARIKDEHARPAATIDDLAERWVLTSWTSHLIGVAARLHAALEIALCRCWAEETIFRRPRS